MVNWWNENWQRKLKYSDKTLSDATLSTTNPVRLDLRSNPRSGLVVETCSYYYSCTVSAKSEEDQWNPNCTSTILYRAYSRIEYWYIYNGSEQLREPRWGERTSEAVMTFRWAMVVNSLSSCRLADWRLYAHLSPFLCPSVNATLSSMTNDEQLFPSAKLFPPDCS
jgi:hypothetical protein